MFAKINLIFDSLNPGVNRIKHLWSKCTHSFLQARSFHSNGINIAYVYKMVLAYIKVGVNLL
jgi:hypothetical protein